MLLTGFHHLLIFLCLECVSMLPRIYAKCFMFYLTLQVNPQFYAFRWITLLLTQEFNFADSIHIWDTLLSDPEGPQVGSPIIFCYSLVGARQKLHIAWQMSGLSAFHLSHKLQYCYNGTAKKRNEKKKKNTKGKKGKEKPTRVGFTCDSI